MAPSPLRSPPKTRVRPRGRVAKLPKMNNSERGKYYRAKYREYELSLEQSVAQLHKQVRDLELFLRVREELAHRNPRDPCEPVVARIFDYFVRARDGLKIESSFHCSSSKANAALSQAHALYAATQSQSAPPPLRSSSSSSSASAFASSSQFMATISSTQAPFSSFSSAHNTSLDLAELQNMMRQMEEHEDTTLFFELVSFQIEGSRAAPVIIMHGELRTQYTRSAVEHLFPHLLDHAPLLDLLLDKEVRYPCAYHFYVGANGVLHDKIVEADYLYGLQQAMGSLEDVMWLLEGAHRLKRRGNSLEELIRGPTPMALKYIMT